MELFNLRNDAHGCCCCSIYEFLYYRLWSDKLFIWKCVQMKDFRYISEPILGLDAFTCAHKHTCAYYFIFAYE